MTNLSISNKQKFETSRDALQCIKDKGAQTQEFWKNFTNKRPIQWVVEQKNYAQVMQKVLPWTHRILVAGFGVLNHAIPLSLALFGTSKMKVILAHKMIGITLKFLSPLNQLRRKCIALLHLKNKMALIFNLFFLVLFYQVTKKVVRAVFPAVLALITPAVFPYVYTLYLMVEIYQSVKYIVRFSEKVTNYENFCESIYENINMILTKKYREFFADFPKKLLAK